MQPPPVQIVEGCSFPLPADTFMTTLKPLPKLVVEDASKANTNEVSMPSLIRGYRAMTEAAVERHRIAKALQAHIRDVAAAKRRCGGTNGDPPQRVATTGFPSTP